MRRDLAALANVRFDVVVIGGGMFGAAAALDAAQRGLKVALVERADFAGATSAHSFKMLHGGIRYLQHADLGRLRQSARARAAFLRVAPHLTRPLPIVVPTYGYGMKSEAALRLGMATYDLLTVDRNRGIGDRSRHIPPARFLGRGEVLEHFPGLDPVGLTGAGIFHDGQMYNPPRLVLAFVQSAAAAGAVCANHVAAERLIVRAGRVEGLRACDRLTGQRFEIRSRLVLNAAGPYADAVLRAGLGAGLSPPTPFSRDAYFIVDRPLLAGGAALAVPSTTSDPDAILSRGARHLFIVPWRGVTLIGVWHKLYPGDPDAFAISEAELAAWIAEINGAYRGFSLTVDDVALGSAGLVPFGENHPDAQHLKYAHRSRIVDHGATGGPDGLVTLVGVRYTTAPVEAPHVVDRVAARLGEALPRSRLTREPVRGGDFAAFAELRAELARAAPAGIGAASLDALACNHGSAADEVLRLADRHPEWSRTLGETPVLAAEVIHAVRSEMALTLADVVFRRTDLCTAGPPPEPVIAEAARLAASAAGWNAARRDSELDLVRRRLRLVRTGRAFLDATALPEPALVA